MGHFLHIAYIPVEDFLSSTVAHVQTNLADSYIGNDTLSQRFDQLSMKLHSKFAALTLRFNSELLLISHPVFLIPGDSFLTHDPYNFPQILNWIVFSFSMA